MIRSRLIGRICRVGIRRQALVGDDLAEEAGVFVDMRYTFIGELDEQARINCNEIFMGGNFHRLVVRTHIIRGFTKPSCT